MNDELPDVPLSAAAKQALDTARALAGRPTDEQRTRMKAALLAKVGGAALTAGTGAKMAATAKSFSGAKLLIGLALVGGAVASVVAAGANHLGSKAPPVPVTSALPASGSAAVAPELPPPEPRASAVIEPGAAPPLPASASSRPVGAASASSTARDDDAFRREVEAVRSAQLHRAESEPDEVLAALRPWTGSTTDPLRDERWSMQIEALCLTGRQAEGQRQRAAFLRALPASPLVSRVRGACAAGGIDADAGAGF